MICGPEIELEFLAQITSLLISYYVGNHWNQARTFLSCANNIVLFVYYL